MKHLTLVVCDVIPDVVKKLPNNELFIDLVDLALKAARHSRTTTTTTTIVHTMINFPDAKYDSIPLSHPKLGILRKLQTKNMPVNWFSSSELCLPPVDNEIVVSRTTYLPQATDTKLMEALRQNNDEDREYVVLGYGPTVQAICHLLGDIVCTSHVKLLEECVRDESTERCQAFLKHGLLFKEEVTSMVDFIESMGLLQESFDDLPSSKRTTASTTKYVCDCDRGGHLSLYMYYLIRDYGYIAWPKQPWFEDITRQGKQYWCPLGWRRLHLCDEPQFGTGGTRFFNSGREWLDQKDYLYQLVPEMMPPTFHDLESARKYSDKLYDHPKIWFLKKVNQNGGRAVFILHLLPTIPLEKDEQLQLHIPRPLLFKKPFEEGMLWNFKCHVKTYQWIGCTFDGNKISWQLYMHDLYYLATANKPYDPNDTSDDVQITTMRTHRLYADNSWRMKWKLTEKCQSRMKELLKRAVEMEKLQCNMPKKDTATSSSSSSSSSSITTTLQFEVNSADWMLDENGDMYLIECNGIPVLYVPEIKQPLITRGLKLYDSLYQKHKEKAAVNDTDLVKDAIAIALKPEKLPKNTLWKHLLTIPHPQS